MTTARLIGLSDLSDLSDHMAELLHATPGALTMARLAEIDPYLLNPSDRIDFLTALDRQDGWLYALRQRAIAAVAGLTPSEGGGALSGVDEAEREDISTALRLAPATAQSRIDIARTLVNNLPNTCAALATGEISSAHATVIARESAAAIRNGAAESTIFEIEQRAIAYAEFHTPGQLTNHIRNTVAKFTPEEYEEAALRATSLRRVSCYNDADGMSTVVAILPAADAQIVMNSIEAFIVRQKQRCREEKISAAGNLTGMGILGRADLNERSSNQSLTFNHRTMDERTMDERTMDQKRADALSAICSNFLADISETVLPQRRPLTINVTIDLPTLLGLAENPGQLAGYGPIPAAIARELASDAKWKRFITEPQTGNLLDFGRESYEPPQHLKDFLIARDRTCRFPGCRRSALLSDLDHAQSWESGGRTSAENIGALCRRHHRLKTHDGWKIESFSDGSCTWTSPLGKRFFTPARSIHETQ